jgi:hypothetical protein
MGSQIVLEICGGERFMAKSSPEAGVTLKDGETKPIETYVKMRYLNRGNTSGEWLRNIAGLYL